MRTATGAGVATRFSNRRFRATRIIACLQNHVTLEKLAQTANQASPYKTRSMSASATKAISMS